MRELRQWQQECRSIEDMRSNALDSLRGLEVEISELQVADKQLKDLKDDYNTLKGQVRRKYTTYFFLPTHTPLPIPCTYNNIFCLLPIYSSIMFREEVNTQACYGKVE